MTEIVWFLFNYIFFSLTRIFFSSFGQNAGISGYLCDLDVQCSSRMFYVKGMCTLQKAWNKQSMLVLLDIWFLQVSWFSVGLLVFQHCMYV